MKWKPKFSIHDEVKSTKDILTSNGHVPKGSFGYVVGYNDQKHWYRVFWYKSNNETNMNENYIKKT